MRMQRNSLSRRYQRIQNTNKLVFKQKSMMFRSGFQLIKFFWPDV